MKTGYRYVSFLFLTAALSAPAVVVTRAAPQDEHRDEHRDEHQKRVYDRAHKDYHNWDDNEDRYYHQYFTENHREYRDYSKLNRRDQDNYWKWRHEHVDSDDRDQILVFTGHCEKHTGQPKQAAHRVYGRGSAGSTNASTLRH